MPLASVTCAPGRRFGGRYRLHEPIGAGGMAVVHRAVDERLGRQVAVKVIADHLALDPLSVRRFRHEAQLSGRLAHPNIVATLDAGVDPQAFIVMELVDGGDAESLRRDQGPLTPEHAVHVVAQVAEALAYAHDQGVVHHDVTARNILVRRRDATVKLADWGVASDASSQRAMHAAYVAGTPSYMAPEILRGATPSPRSDIYSLGVVAYRLLTGPPGRRPASATTPLSTAVPRLDRLADVRPDLPDGLIDAVQRAIEREPDARQEAVKDLRTQLLDALCETAGLLPVAA
jgi:serine/threonine-protein kinase